MLYARINKKGEVTDYPLHEDQVRRLFPDVSLPENLEESDLTHLGIERVKTIIAPPAKPGHKVELGKPERVKGELVRTFQQVPLGQDEVRDAWRQCRARRLQLLRSSDWTQLPDAPLSKEKKKAWATYRQALRDITKQDPTKIDWPTPPVSF